MYIIFILVAVVIVGFLIERFVFSSHFSDDARRQFILDSLKTRSFKELTRDHQQIFTFNGRKATAHWKVYEKPEPYIIEFDVHPSTNPCGTISRSEFITIRNEKHLNEIKESIQRMNTYDQFLTPDKIVDNICNQ